MRCYGIFQSASNGKSTIIGTPTSTIKHDVLEAHLRSQTEMRSQSDGKAHLESSSVCRHGNLLSIIGIIIKLHLIKIIEAFTLHIKLSDIATQATTYSHSASCLCRKLSIKRVFLERLTGETQHNVRCRTVEMHTFHHVIVTFFGDTDQIVTRSQLSRIWSLAH